MKQDSLWVEVINIILCFMICGSGDADKREPDPDAIARQSGNYDDGYISINDVDESSNVKIVVNGKTVYKKKPFDGYK